MTEATNNAAPPAAELAAPSPEAAAARAEHAALMADPQFVAKFNSKDPVVAGEALAQSQRLNRIGFPGETQTAHAYVQHDSAAPSDPRDGPPATPSEYRFDYAPGATVDAARDAEYRDLLHSAGLPTHVAKVAFDALNRAAAEAAAGKFPTPAELELQARSGEARLRSMWGDAFEQKVTAAKSVLKAMPPDKCARLIQLLDRTGVGNNVMLVTQLATLGEMRGLK